VSWGPAGGHQGCRGGGGDEGGQLVQLGVFHSPDILSHRLVVAVGEAELVQLEAWLVWACSAGGAQLEKLWLDGGCRAWGARSAVT
jgi:hypothetical protein